MNFFAELGDAFNTLNELAKDVEAETKGQEVDTTALAEDFLKDLQDVHVNLPWLTPELVSIGLQAFFSAIQAHKPAS